MFLCVKMTGCLHFTPQVHLAENKDKKAPHISAMWLSFTGYYRSKLSRNKGEVKKKSTVSAR